MNLWGKEKPKIKKVYGKLCNTFLGNGPSRECGVVSNNTALTVEILYKQGGYIFFNNMAWVACIFCVNKYMHPHKCLFIIGHPNRDLYPH